ncbi:MAG: hypothetical protein NW200_03895 [Hyphomonadaceae bacterium]|nr:hypothetical protein [Hyphomonadaceae bacterium]
MGLSVLRAFAAVLGGAVVVAALVLVGVAWQRAQAASVKAGVSIVDGDTFDYGGKRFRVFELDAPDQKPHAKCDAEAALYAASKAHAQRLVAVAQSAEIRPTGRVQPATERYRERVEARLFLDGRNFTDLMVEHGHGKYTGAGGWCETPTGG